MRTFSRILLGVLVLVLVAVVGVYWWQRPLLRTGTGYAAHNACAVTYVADRDDPESDLPDNPLVPYLRSSELDEPGSEASLLGLLAKQRAWFTEGFGCTLADDRPDLGEATEVDSDANPFSDTATTTAAPEVADALAEAFGDDLPIDEQDALGTRAVVVVKDGEIVAERYADGFGPETVQLGWSMSKSVASLLAGRLVHEGELSVDDDALRDEWNDERADITVEHLLRMTSGLSWDETYDLGTPITQMLYAEPDMAGYVTGRESAHAAGTYQQYSSGSTNLLCAVRGVTAGVQADLPRRELFAPLGLSSAVLEPDASGTPVCSSYLWATPRDWAALGQFALEDGVWDGERLLPEGWMDWSTSVVDVDETEDPAYAAGWWVNELADDTLDDPLLPADAYWASGHDGQRIVVVPSEDLVVVRLGFTPELDEIGVSELTADLIEMLG